MIYCNPTITVAGQQEEVREAGLDSTPKHFTPKNSGESKGQKSGDVTERGTMAKCKQDRDIKPPRAPLVPSDRCERGRQAREAQS